MKRAVRNLLLLSARGGIKWLLRDEFTDTRAAGAVNGTPATPGPGTRVVTDTGNDLSISAGILNITAPTNIGDPGLWYGALVRAAGRFVVIQVTLDNSIIPLHYHGFDADQATWPFGAHAFYFRREALQLIAYDNSIESVVGVFAVSTSYKLCIVLRATGAYYFIKGGAFTNWTLLWVSTSINTTPLYPCHIAWENTFTSDYLRIPDALWLPQPAAFDSFSRANGVLGTSEMSGPDSQAVTARAWTDNVGTWAIAGNVATCSALAGGLGFATVDTSTINVVMQGTITRAGNEVGLILRYVDADNYIRAIHDGTNMKLVKRVAAAETDVISAVVAIGAGAVVVVADGTTFRLYLNNAQVGATSTIADAALQTGTRQGLFTTNVGNTMDALLVMARGGAAYNALDKWSS